jgi:hypothetical protein
MRFSQRIGKRQVKTILQLEVIDTDLLNRLWNIILKDFFDEISDYSRFDSETQKCEVCRIMWKEFFKYPIDKSPKYNSGVTYVPEFIQLLRNWFYKSEWYDIFDLIEFMAFLSDKIGNLKFINQCNLALEKEVSGYRIVNEKVVQITSEDEVKEIENAIESTDKWSSVNTHLLTALDMLADRKNPDYRNSIKESISAVESLCIIITGDENATLGKALLEIEKKYFLHKALKNSFSALYGYTSDSSGIRHALSEDDDKVGFEDAKFILVSCSAFINYLKAKIDIGKN